MTTIQFVAAIAGVVFCFILAIYFSFPSSKRGKKKRKKTPPAVPETSVERSVDAAVSRYRQHIETLRRQIVQQEKREKALERQMLVEKVKIKKLKEKLSQERHWQEKEHKNIEKKNNDYAQVKSEMDKLQESFGKEHAANLRFQQDLKEKKAQIDGLNDQRRALESENAQLKAQIDNQRSSMNQLKMENTQLKKKNEDTQWIAKSEYDKVEQELREKEKQLERLKREGG